MKKKAQSKRQDAVKDLFWVKAVSGAAACSCTCADACACPNTAECFMA